MGGDSLSDELPSLALNDGFIVHRDLSIAGGWALQLPNTMLAGNSVRANVTTLFRSIFNSLPPQYDWQFRWVQHGRTAELEKLFEDRPKPEGLAGEIVRETEMVNLHLMANRSIAWKEAQLFIVRRPAAQELLKEAGSKQSKFSKFSSGFKLFLKALLPGSAIAEAQANEEVFTKMMTDLDGMMKTLEPLIKSMGLFPKRISNDTAMAILYQWANKERFEFGGTPAKYPEHGGVPLCELFALTEFDKSPTEDGRSLPPGVFRMGGQFQTILTLALPPEELKLGIWEEILYGRLTRMEVTAWGSPQDKSKRISKLTRLRNVMKSAKNNDPAKNKQRADIDRELEELGGNQDRLWRVFVTFRLWGDSPDEVIQAANGLIFACESNGRIALVHERKNMWAFLRATCPGWTQDCDPYRALDLTTRQTARILPINGQPTYLTMKPEAVGAVFPTISSTSGLFNIDPHERALYAAPHFMVAAGTGAGKSVLVSSLMLELLGADGRAVMIDRGGSFDGIAAAMGATPIRLAANNHKVTLNPLYVTKGNLPDPDELGCILALLEVMVMSAAQKEGRLDGEQGRLLRDTLQRLFEEKPGEERTLSQLRDKLASGLPGRWLASQLSVWCGGGDYGTMFDGMNNIPMGGRLTVIDLGQDTRGNNQALTNVLTMLLISIVSQLMAHGGVRRKYVIFDEAGVLMKNPAQAEFLNYAYRTFRKTGTGVGALTQKAMDLEDIFSYAPLKFFLRQDDLADTRMACQKAGFSEETLDFIGNLESRIGEYADFIVVQHTTGGTTQAHLCRNYVTPLKYAMITSEKEDTFWMANIMKTKNIGKDAAMREFAKQYPRGIAWARTNGPEKIAA